MFMGLQVLKQANLQSCLIDMPISIVDILVICFQTTFTPFHITFCEVSYHDQCTLKQFGTSSVSLSSPN